MEQRAIDSSKTQSEKFYRLSSEPNLITPSSSVVSDWLEKQQKLDLSEFASKAKQQNV